MTASGKKTPHLDNFFMTSSMRLDRWRDLNAKAQTWAAEARGPKAHSGRVAVEAALAAFRSAPMARAGGHSSQAALLQSGCYGPAFTASVPNRKASLPCSAAIRAPFSQVSH